MSANYTYNKNEKLKSRKELDVVFKSKSFLIFPLKVFYCFSEANNTDLIKCGVGTSKKKFANAVDRNRVKRLLREAYRLNKTSLHETVIQKKLSFFILYIDKTMPEKLSAVDEKMKLVIAKLNKRYTDEMAAETI